MPSALTLSLSLTLAAPGFDLVSWNEDRLATQATGLWILGGWAAANLVVGGVGGALSKDEELRWILWGSALWNTVNAALAIIGLASDWNADPASFDARASLLASTSTWPIFAINAGVDLGYLAGGGLLWQRGAGKDARLTGIGKALLIQGAFLLVFDVVMAALHGALNARLLDNLTVSAGGPG